MAGIGSLFNVPGSQAELDTWAFAHAIDHRDIIAAIKAQANVSLQEFSLDPIPLDNINNWVYQHSQMHKDMNEIVGIDSLNLVSVDWEDKLSRASWILSNASEHRQAHDILRIGQATSPGVVTSVFRSSATGGGGASIDYVGQAIGPASSDRYVVVCVSSSGPPGRSLSSATIAGRAATILAQNVNSVPGASRSTAIIIALVQTGTSGTIHLEFSGGGTVSSISTYSLTGITSPAASQVANSSATSPSASLTVNQNGAIIAVASTGSLAGASAGWSNINTDVTTNFGGGNQVCRSSGSKNFPSQLIGLNVSCFFSGSGVGLSSGTFAVFNPPLS